MLWNRNTWQISIFTKLVLIFLVVIIPLYATGLIINGWGEKSIRREISKSIMSKMHYYLNSLEVEIRHINNRQYECLSEYNLQLLSIAPKKLSDYDQAMAIFDLGKKLRTVADSSVYIKDISIHIPILAKTVSAGELFSEIPEQEFDALIKLKMKANSPLVYWNGRIFLSLFYPNPSMPDGEKPQYLIDTELSKTEMEKALSQFTDYDGSGFALINQNQDWIVSNAYIDKNAAPAVNQFFQQQMRKSITTGIGTIKIDNKPYIIVYDTSSYLGVTLITYIPENQVMGPLKNYQIWFWALSFISIIIIIFFSYTIFQLIHRPLHKLVGSFRKVDAGELDISIKHGSNDEFRYLYEHFNIMVDKLKKLIHQVYEEQLLSQRAELKQLQSQINPHFLYNSFYILYRMVKPLGDERVTDFCQRLGRYFEFITRSAADEVPLKVELEHARTYVDIQTLRFSNRIQVAFDDLPETYNHLVVPRLILQPIIENAYEHGLDNKMSDGRIYIGIMSAEDRLVISVEDNGEEMDDIKLKNLQNALSSIGKYTESTGIINVHRRLQLKFGPDAGLRISCGQPGGLRVEINIPFEKEDKACTAC